MSTPMTLDPAQLSMTEIIRLQTLLSQELTRRFETSAALVFSDIVGSTPYFARFGDETGRQLQQLHLDLLAQGLAEHGGRIVDTAGDGAFVCFASATGAAVAMTELLLRVSDANQHRHRDHQLTLRIGIHWGRVLTDGVQVTGDAVNLCARIAGSADAGQIRLSREVFQELGMHQRLACRTLGPIELKGVARRIELLGLEWRDPTRFPTSVRIRETGQDIELPLQDILSFGRLELIEGLPANDIVLSLPDPIATRQISRWHCELRRRASGYVLRAVSGQSTTVNGVPLPMGEELPVLPGTVVVLSNVMTLQFVSPEGAEGGVSDTTMFTRTLRPAGDKET
jgi:class 3 adenylate cyclase